MLKIRENGTYFVRVVIREIIEEKKWNWSILEEKAERKETLDRREWRGERQREMEEEGEGEIGKRDNAANWLNDYNNNDNSNNNDNNKVHFFTRRLKRKNRREVKW